MKHHDNWRIQTFGAKWVVDVSPRIRVSKWRSDLQIIPGVGKTPRSRGCFYTQAVGLCSPWQHDQAEEDRCHKLIVLYYLCIQGGNGEQELESCDRGRAPVQRKRQGVRDITTT